MEVAIRRLVVNLLSNRDIYRITATYMWKTTKIGRLLDISLSEMLISYDNCVWTDEGADVLVGSIVQIIRLKIQRKGSISKWYEKLIDKITENHELDFITVLAINKLYWDNSK